MALLTERCLFVNFPYYHKTFLSEVDFDWGHHSQRLLSFGHDVTKTPPHQIQVCVSLIFTRHRAVPTGQIRVSAWTATRGVVRRRVVAACSDTAATASGARQAGMPGPK